MKCIPCLRTLHNACKKKECDCTHDSLEAKDNEDDDTDINEERRSSRYKRDDALVDQQSTGRKRAARLYPVICVTCNTGINLRSKKCEDCESPTFPDCEWKGQANCGGGYKPILGCTNGVQTDRHHGPDKSVTNNDEGNVHRICTWCHHEWHAKNNPTYDWSNTVFQDHSPRKWTIEEELEARIRDHERANRKVERIAD